MGRPLCLDTKTRKTGRGPHVKLSVFYKHTPHTVESASPKRTELWNGQRIFFCSVYIPILFSVIIRQQTHSGRKLYTYIGWVGFEFHRILRAIKSFRWRLGCWCLCGTVSKQANKMMVLSLNDYTISTFYFQFLMLIILTLSLCKLTEDSNIYSSCY